ACYAAGFTPARQGKKKTHEKTIALKPRMDTIATHSLMRQGNEPSQMDKVTSSFYVLVMSFK
ncbi:MAG: hypothetical protein LBU41_04125, partial [Clostridiales Family XIII bacterium]|nr:hypothetical protein [Clostridiales Family XIII bacterium]